MDLATGERRLRKVQPVIGYDAALYATERVWAPARDGKRIPVSLVYRRDRFKRDGTAPLYIDGYGAYGLANDPYFSGNRVSLLDRGFVIAVAHVRGGAELGQGWYEAGRLLAKHNTFNDFVDVTDHLVRERYGAQDRVFASGGSAGGLLMGVIANQAGDRYRGIALHVPFVDAVTTMLDESIPLTTNEWSQWGDPREKHFYDYMLAYSPYDNIRRARVSGDARHDRTVGRDGAVLRAGQVRCTPARHEDRPQPAALPRDDGGRAQRQVRSLRAADRGCARVCVLPRPGGRARVAGRSGPRKRAGADRQVDSDHQLLASTMPRAIPLSLGVIALVAVTAACDGAKAPPAARSAPEVTVLTVKPQSVVIKTVLPGRTAPTVIAEVRPQVTGIVQSRTYSEGAEVKAGSTLYRLDPATYQTAYDSARAAVAKAEASVETARRNLARAKELFEIKFVSQQAYDDAATTLRQSEADLAGAKAAAEAARINLAYTNVVAPISGRIGKSTVTAGALVTANQPAPLATIQQMNPMYVDITQSSNEALRLRRAMASGELKRARDDAARVTLQLEDGTSYPHEGTLQFSDVTVDASTGAITLRALFPNPESILLPNMYVRAVLEEGVRDNAILVPQQAVTRDTKGQAIAMVVGANNTVEARPLKTARTLGTQWLIDAGLQPGDRVIVEGLQRANPGATVQPMEASAPPAAATSAPAAATPASAPAAGKAQGR